ncbi:MAG: cytochrome c peroxidase [Pirellulaceae bacterium]|nr:cytochrome c peroxidase [Pirellulaceae bacterium]
MIFSVRKTERSVLFVGLLIALLLFGSRATANHSGELDSNRSNDSETTVVLGGDDLTAGIPGSGPLTLDEIRVWLSNAQHHQPLTVQLPLGLDKAAANIQGVDKNPLTKAKIELGRQLYFDTRLSIDNTVSCASCHDPNFGYAKDTRFGVGIKELEGNRNSPVAYNRIVTGAQFWDGRAGSLEEQAVGPIANPIEMGNTHQQCVETLRQIPGYAIQFEAIFSDGVTIENVGQVIASFERVIVTGPAPFDYQERLESFETAFAAELEDLSALAEEDPDLFFQFALLKKNVADAPMSDSAKRGRVLFFDPKINCATCHSGANFADELYHNLGVGMDAKEPDLGRHVVTKEEKDKGAFKTPTLRNVELTAPYMHDGSQKTLLEVVEWYAKGGHPNPTLSDKVKKFDATQQDKEDLVEFMRALTGTFPKVCTDRLPK